MCNNKEDGLAEILKVILMLQQNACPDNCLDSCDRPALGGGPSCLICNTRPIMLYLCSGNGVPLSMPISKDLTNACSNTAIDVPSPECSNVFRVEKLEDDCCTFRVLTRNPDTTSAQPYLPTNSIFTVKLSCCCMIRCLNDCYVDCVL